MSVAESDLSDDVFIHCGCDLAICPQCHPEPALDDFTKDDLNEDYVAITARCLNVYLNDGPEAFNGFESTPAMEHVLGRMKTELTINTSSCTETLSIITVNKL